jgi:hypothetical protein
VVNFRILAVKVLIYTRKKKLATTSSAKKGTQLKVCKNEKEEGEVKKQLRDTNPAKN